MGTLIAVFAYFCYGFYCYVNGGTGEKEDFLFLTVLFLLGTSGSVLIGGLLARFLSIFFAQTRGEEPSEVFDLVCLERNGQLSGNFFLGIGNIGESSSYFFYTKNEEGGYVPKNLPVDDNITFFEGEEYNQHPRMEVYQIDFSSKWAWLFVFLTSEKEYKFYIPKNSIKTGFKM